MTDAEKYEREVSREARARQQAEARVRFACCGERRADGHHPACSKRPPDPEINDAQERLL